MKALRIHGMKDVRVDTVDDPEIKDSRDAIIRVTSTAICGSDLHLYNGSLPQPRPMALGHEFMGIVEEVGKGVGNLKRGDRVVVPFPVACGHCLFCNHELPGHCENSNPEHYGPEGGLMTEKGGALFGYSDLYGGYDGGQADYVRVPYAETSVYKLPPGVTNQQGVLLSDILPTGFEIGVQYGRVKPGDVVAVIGAGPVGLAVIMTAGLYGAARIISVDLDPNRIEQALKGIPAAFLVGREGSRCHKVNLNSPVGELQFASAICLPV